MTHSSVVQITNPLSLAVLPRKAAKLMVSQTGTCSVNTLKLWARLYLLIWLAFGQFFVTIFSQVFGIRYLHSMIGLVILVLAFANYRGIIGTLVSDRVKRISKAIPVMAALDGILGVLLYVLTDGVVHWMTKVLHLVFSLAVVAQASSTATAYDMWEEKECK